MTTKITNWSEFSDVLQPDKDTPFLIRMWYDGWHYMVLCINSKTNMVNDYSSGDEDKSLEKFIDLFKGVEWCYVPD